MENYKKFNSIDNVDRKRNINVYTTLGFTSEEWEVTEKVHGSNASIWYDGSNLKVGKRSGWIKEDENFNNLWKVTNKIKYNIQEMYKALSKDKNASYITVYGEICGGSYDHPDVEKVPDSIRCQKGIFYSPDNIFYGFDICIDGEYLNTYDVEKYFSEYNIFYAKSLFRGSFNECLEYPNKFNSKIPEWLGLPLLDENICEGVVLRPVTPRFLACGSRVILKNKNEKWEEKSYKPKREKKSKKQVVMSDDANKLLEEIKLYITENRLRNVLSKLGEVTSKDFGKLLGLLSVDVMTDFKKDNEEKFNELPKDEQKTISKLNAIECSNLIRTNFVNIIDGEF